LGLAAGEAPGVELRNGEIPRHRCNLPSGKPSKLYLWNKLAQRGRTASAGKPDRGLPPLGGPG